MTATILDVPYHSQLNNVYDPYGSCNVTALAGCLNYWKVKHPPGQQLEDYLYQRALNNGWNRFSKEGIKALAESFTGIYDDLTDCGTLQDIRDAIDKGLPCIVHGYFTEPGHIIVVRGYDEYGFYVNDSFGNPSGLSGYNTGMSGENLHFSNGLMTAACDSWCFGEANVRYPMGDKEAEKANSIWLHRINRVNM